MRWLLSLILGLLIAWMIVMHINKMQPAVSYYQADTIPAEIAHVDDSLVAVGLAQFPDVPSIMDTIDHPVPAYGKAPSPRVIEGSLPDPNFTPNPAMVAAGPSPSIPSSGTMSPISGKGFTSPAPAPGPSPDPPMTTPPVPATPAPTMSSTTSPAPMPIVPNSSSYEQEPEGFSSGSPFLSL